MTTLETFAFLMQLAAAFMSFSCALFAFLLYRRFRQRLLLYAGMFLASFCIMSISSFSYFLQMHLFAAEPAGTAAGHLSFLAAWPLSAVVSFLFLNGLGGLILELGRYPASPLRRRLILFITVGLILSWAPLHLFFARETAVQVYNLLAIWIPGFAALCCALWRFKIFHAGMYKKERLLFLILVVLNILFALPAFVYAEFLMIVPFLFIICLCVMVLVLISRHFFPASYTLQREDSLELPGSFARIYALTSREEEIVRALLTGRQNREIASQLYVSLKTVETHLGNIYRKTGTSGRLALFALVRQGFP